jgi:hypothetical protein
MQQELLNTSDELLKALDEAAASVSLRLMGAKVPAIYGPSADDKQFL